MDESLEDRFSADDRSTKGAKLNQQPIELVRHFSVFAKERDRIIGLDGQLVEPIAADP
jgi:hypothetical protein